MRRLFSTFASGLPGAGLLLLRLAAGSAAIAQVLTRLRSGPLTGSMLLDALPMAAGITLFAGLWTPISGSVVAILGFWNAVSRPGDPWADILLGSIGAALAMVGPGAWSIDARLFGWRRIDFRDRKS